MKIHSLIMLLVLSIIFAVAGCSQDTPDVYEKDGISMVARTNGDAIEIYDGEAFDASFLTGMNMGAAKPGHFPGEMAIPKSMYMEWFEQIHAMNADVIRVYTTMMPHFYEALEAFNKTVEKPLYIMQGVWLNEYEAKNQRDIYGNEGQLVETFINEALDLVDIIHGNATIERAPGLAHGTYETDVSAYVVGWILGVEWDPRVVTETNSNHPDMDPHDGNFIHSTPEASAFETFLAQVSDTVVRYEVENYDFMRPMSFVNWPTTDHLDHPNEPDPMEDYASVNPNHIKPTDSFSSGMFASYHVYPYYPEFMNYSEEYTNHYDHRGELNPYQGYIQDLKANVNMPIVVAEFGVPSSRGKTHEAVHSGFDQGHVSEREQGRMNAHMLEDIYKSDYAGGFVFTWQDEWFKRTWNTMDFDLDHRRPFWSNVQTNEQHFGVLAFDPGDGSRKHYVDGDPSTWKDSVPVVEDDAFNLFTAFDERYMYIYVEGLTYTPSKDRLLIPISITDSHGNTYDETTHATFSHPTDFLIEIEGTSAIMRVDAYYDPFYYLYGEVLGNIPTHSSYRNKDTGIFNRMYQALSSEIYLPEEDRHIPFSKHETGQLTFGNANPAHVGYHSLSDYYYENGTLELKIPWQMLNISDPSTKMRLDDFYASDLVFDHASLGEIFIGAGVYESKRSAPEITMHPTTWEAWDIPTYHSRLKPSYYILKEAFSIYD